MASHRWQDLEGGRHKCRNCFIITARDYSPHWKAVRDSECVAASGPPKDVPGLPQRLDARMPSLSSDNVLKASIEVNRHTINDIITVLEYLLATKGE